MDKWVVVFKELYRILKHGCVVKSRESLFNVRGHDFVLDVSNRVVAFMQNRGQDPFISLKIPSHLSNVGFKII
ncbi:hypothetical protein BC941DRAFT_437425 [Chlamydoabsidia padenii]|nr:hypothetical protein BC941DRAFT_437425 [Chlamydoabsidia padenii]